MQRPIYQLRCRKNAVSFGFKYGTGAGEINRGPPFGFLGHAGCDWDEEIFSPRVRLSFMERRSSINFSTADFGLCFLRLLYRTYHLCSIIAMMLHVIWTILQLVKSLTLVILRSFFTVASLLISPESNAEHAVFHHCLQPTFDRSHSLCPLL